MTYRTESDAMQLPCPVARIQGDAGENGKVNSKCRGSACMMWRWRPVSVFDPRYKSALTREIALVKEERKEDGNGKIKGVSDDRAHKIATANLAENLEGYITFNGEDQGYCGMGGKP